MLRRAITAWFFVSLVLLVCAELRIAELDLTPGDEVALENDEQLDGGEILDRLITIDAMPLPRPPVVGRVAIAPVSAPAVHGWPAVPLVGRTPRAPPPSPVR